MHSIRRRLVYGMLCLAALAAIPCSHAQDGPITTLKVDAKLVTISAIARGESGQPVRDLTRESFVLKQDGKFQNIDSFSSMDDLPLTLALMVDTSGSQLAFIEDEVNASSAFFPALLTRRGDRALIIEFDAQIRVLSDLTDSMPVLKKGLYRLSSKEHESAGATRLFDAICATAHLELGNERGRRAMVLLTDGGDYGSEAKLKQAVEEAQRADIMIYSIFYSRGGGNKDALNRLSKVTGGRVFTVGPKMTLAQVYDEIRDDLRLEYEIAYRPPPSKPDRFHKIELQTVDKKISVQAREGYFSK